MNLRNLHQNLATQVNIPNLLLITLFLLWNSIFSTTVLAEVKPLVRLVHTLPGHNKGLCAEQCLAFSPDGKILASASIDNTIKLWQMSNNQLLHLLKGHQQWVDAVIFTTDGQTLISAGGDKTIRFWNVKSGQQQRILPRHHSYISSLALTQDGSLLASGDGDNTIHIWDLNENKIQFTLRGHSDAIYSVVFSLDRQQLAFGSRDNTVRLGDVRTGKLYSQPVIVSLLIPKITLF